MATDHEPPAIEPEPAKKERPPKAATRRQSPEPPTTPKPSGEFEDLNYRPAPDPVFRLSDVQYAAWHEMAETLAQLLLSGSEIGHLTESVAAMDAAAKKNPAKPGKPGK